MPLKFTPINKGIFFKFDEAGSKGMLTAKSNSGIIINATDSKYALNNHAKWGKVCLTGPDVSSDIKEGLYVLIKPLQWTTGLSIDGETFWKTDEDKILAVSEFPTNQF